MPPRRRRTKARKAPAFPTGVEARYRAMMLRRIRALDRLVRTEILPALDPMDTSKAGAKILGGGDELRVDAFGGPLALIAFLRAAFVRANPIPPEFLIALVSAVERRLSAVFGAAIVGIPNEIPVDGWISENVRLITSLQSDYLDQVAEIIEAAQRGGISTKATAEMIRARTGVAKSRAKLIARDQIATVNAQITRQRQTEAGVSHFIWRTSQDERVRPSHEALEGQEFAWNAPPVEGIPGEPIQCRCTAEPVLDALARA